MPDLSGFGGAREEGRAWARWRSAGRHFAMKPLRISGSNPTGFRVETLRILDLKPSGFVVRPGSGGGGESGSVAGRVGQAGNVGWGWVGEGWSVGFVVDRRGLSRTKLLGSRSLFH